MFKRKGRVSSRALLPVPLLTTFMFVCVCFTSPALADQNGTSCPDYIQFAGGQWAELTIDANCDAFGDPQRSEYYGTGTHNGCYSDGGETAGQNANCEPCPSDRPRCTPCDNWEPECGSETPDPPPDTSANFFWTALDWLTA